MGRRSGWVALASGASLAAVGAVTAYVSAGGPWAAFGAAIGAVAGGFAPSVYDSMRMRGGARKFRQGTAEEAPPHGWARLLDPRNETVGFVGREAELATLMAWCVDQEASRLNLVTGQGGVGKTRLAIELMRRMRDRGWKCERVADGKEAEAVGALRALTAGPVLLVVDYAETRVGLGQMLSALASGQGYGMRVLLLARSAGDWWDQLGSGQTGVRDLVQYARSAELTLSPVVAADLSDDDVIAQAVSSFARQFGLPERPVEIFGGSSSGRMRVLDLHAAALVAVLAAGNIGTVRVDLRTVLDELLRHEMHFWYASARIAGLTDGPSGLPAPMIRRIVATGCLLGAATEEEARALPSRVPGLSASAKVARWLHELYPPGPGEPDWLGSLQPSSLAELHAVRELAASPELAGACLTNLNSRQARRVVALLAQASSDYPQAETLLGQTLPEVADFIVGLDVPLPTLTAIFNAIPYPTVILASAAVSLAQQIIALLPTRPTLQAYWLSVLGVRLSAVGSLTEALTAEQKAVAIRRELAATDPDRYRPDLAQSLNNLGVTFSELGRHGDALPVTQEAVAIRREFAAADPDRYRPDLAQSLNNLGVRLSLAGRHADALPVTEEAVTTYRGLAAASPDRYSPDLAESLNNLGIVLSELRRPGDALTAEQEAVAVRRELAAADPDRYRPDLAQSLNNLGIMLSELGRHADALPVTEEAAAVYRELTAAKLDRYRPALARSLAHLADVLTALDKDADADAARKEAGELRY